MSISVVIALAAVFFIVGVLFIIKGVSTEEEKVVPISNPQEIEELKSAFAPLPQKQQGAIKPIIGEPAEMPEKNQNIGDGSNHARAQQLKDENEQLKTQIADQKRKFDDLERSIQILREDYNRIKESESDKIKLLEEKVEQARREKEQMIANQRLIDELKTKGEVFEKQHDEHQTLQREMKEFIQKLERERDELLKLNQKTVDKSELQMMEHRLSGSIEEIETLKSENKSLLEVNQRLKETFRKTEETNDQLLKKEKLLQFELAKNRAQVLGLEKICADFKVQIETLSASAPVS